MSTQATTKAYLGDFAMRHANPVPKEDKYKARQEEAKAYNVQKILEMMADCSPEDLQTICNAAQGMLEEESPEAETPAEDAADTAPEASDEMDSIDK